MTKEVKIMGVIAVVVLAVAAFFLLKQPATAPASKPVDSQSLVRQGSHMTGSANAKVTIVEFGDFQCPACAAAFPAVEQMVQKYKDNKDVNFVFRNFPLPQHQNALITAETAEAAGAQGKYWEMYRKLYSTQSDWESLNSADALNKMLSYAQELGLNVDQVKSEILAKKYSDVITADQNDGVNLGVNSTPTFFINGVKQVGMNPLVFNQAITDALAK